jgi:hypothetical protein
MVYYKDLGVYKGRNEESLSEIVVSCHEVLLRIA